MKLTLRNVLLIILPSDLFDITDVDLTNIGFAFVAELTLSPSAFTRGTIITSVGGLKFNRFCGS